MDMMLRIFQKPRKIRELTLERIKEKEPNIPILNIIVCFIPTEEFITCQCEKEYDLEEHF